MSNDISNYIVSLPITFANITLLVKLTEIDSLRGLSKNYDEIVDYEFDDSPFFENDTS